DGTGAVLSAAIFVPVVPVATQVLSWGSSSSDSTMPSGLTNVVAVSTRSSTTIAIRADGTIVRWGGYSGSTIPADVSNVVAVALASSYYLALRADGTVTTWSDSTYSPPPAVPSGLANVVAVAAGTSHSLAVKSHGPVVR